MARSSFVSFHYQRDHWRVQQILRMGALDNQTVLPAQDWEQVKRRGEKAVYNWIDEQMKYKQAVVVMIGAETSSRKFVQYEIRRAWEIRKPLLGINIHGLKNANGFPDRHGANPFAQFGFNDSSKTFADYVPVFDPAEVGRLISPTSSDIYATIANNIANWTNRGYCRP